MRHVRDIVESSRAPTTSRGTPGDRVELERLVRRRAIAWARAASDRTREEAAAALHLSARTLCDWGGRWREDRLAAVSRGRPREEPSRDDRVRLIGLLWVLGVRTGYATIRPYFPRVSRRELRSLLARTRRAWKRLEKKGSLALRWMLAGTVWAIDFTQPPTPVEGRYERVLLVRDLSSGMALLALPCEDETAATAVAALRSLFLEHGAPLVLKMDNGSAFVSEELAALLDAFGVTALFSPPYWPAYNGAIEAGVGSIKTRCHHRAAREGRAGRWTCDDVEGARLEANETGRPSGALGPVPRERWDLRERVGLDERDLFRQAVERAVAEERSRRGFDREREPSKDELASVRRAGIARALAERGYLEFRTRRVSPPIASFFSAIIS